MTTKELAMLLLQYPSNTEVLFNRDMVISSIGKNINGTVHIILSDYKDDKMSINVNVTGRNKYCEEDIEY